MNKPNDIYHHYQYMMKPDFVPLKLRSNESPQLVGTYPKNIERDYCYMGGGYKMDWIPQSFVQSVIPVSSLLIIISEFLFYKEAYEQTIKD